MSRYSTRAAAKKLGIHFVTLQRYITAKKIPAPPSEKVGGSFVRAWTDKDIERVRKMLPKIANGRKTRYKRANSNSQLATGQTRPKSKTRSRGKSNSKKKKT